MNVAIFTDRGLDADGGVPPALRAIVENAPPDVRVRIYTCGSRHLESPECFAARGLGLPWARAVYLPRFGRFADQAAADGVDLVHLATRGPVALGGMYVAADLGVPIVGSFHPEPSTLSSRGRSSSLRRLRWRYLKWWSGRCLQILVPSTAAREELIACGIAPTAIAQWGGGVSSDRFAPQKRTSLLRRLWGVGDEGLAILYAGPLSNEDGLDLFAPLGERLRRSGLDHRFVFAGDGPMRRTLADACPSAAFLGNLSPDDLAAAMASADLFISPSRRDMTGDAILEAQASGLPALVTDEGAPQEIIRQGHTGHVCRDVRAFARRIAELTWNLDRRRRFSLAARAHAAAHDWKTALTPFYDAYREAETACRFNGRLDARPAAAR